MCQKSTDSQKPLSGACAKVQGQATAQLQLSNQSPVMCQLGISVMRISKPKLAVRLHLNSDAVDRLSGSVENPSEWLRRHVHDQTSLAVPFLNRLHDITVWRQFGTIWSKIVYRSLDLIEHKYRWPPMMMNRLFVVWLQGYLKHAKALVLEDDFVVLRSRHHRIQCWIPSRWIQIRTIIRHVTLASSVQGLNSIAQLDLSDVR